MSPSTHQRWYTHRSSHWISHEQSQFSGMLVVHVFHPQHRSHIHKVYSRGQYVTIYQFLLSSCASLTSIWWLWGELSHRCILWSSILGALSVQDLLIGTAQILIIFSPPPHPAAYFAILLRYTFFPSVIYFWCVTPSLMLFDSCKRCPPPPAFLWIYCVTPYLLLFHTYQRCPPAPAFFENLLRHSLCSLISYLSELSASACVFCEFTA